MSDKHGPSSWDELKALEILNQQLSSYYVHPHMRLSNVLDGKPGVNYGEKSNVARFEIDFTIRNKKDGSVIFVIELDGKSHQDDTQKEYDKKKNQLLAQAGIPLIRIENPASCSLVREIAKQQGIELTEEPYQKPEFLKGKSRSKKQSMWLKIGITFGGMIGIMVVFVLAIKQITSSLELRATEAKEKNQSTLEAPKKSIEVAPPENHKNTQPPQYQKIFIPAQSAKICAPDNVFDEDSVACLRGRWETILVTEH